MIVGFKKHVSTLLATALLCTSLGGVASAAVQPNQAALVEQPSIIIQWDNTTSVSTSLTFDGSKGICGARVVGVTGTSNIIATAMLQRKNANGTFTTIKTWSGLSATGERLTFDSSYYVTAGYTYRLTISATVYLYGVGEIVSSYSEAYAA